MGDVNVNKTGYCVDCGCHPAAFSDRFGDHCWHCQEDKPCPNKECACAGRDVVFLEPKHNALQTLWGSGDPEKDRRRRNTAKSMISPAEGGVQREQTIYTPQVILDVVAATFGDIALDPAAGPASLVKAAKYYAEADDGLAQPWEDRTFVNPPYKNLKQWLEKAEHEAEAAHRIVMLCPVRPHRKWFREMMRNPRVQIVYLDPLCFEGFKQAFPAPLCLIFWNCDPPDCRSVSK